MSEEETPKNIRKSYDKLARRLGLDPATVIDIKINGDRVDVHFSVPVRVINIEFSIDSTKEDPVCDNSGHILEK